MDHILNVIQVDTWAALLNSSFANLAMHAALRSKNLTSGDSLFLGVSLSNTVRDVTIDHL